MNKGKKYRNKTIAVLLSLFFGPLAWIYIYRKSFRRFWFFFTSQALVLLLSFLLKDYLKYFLAFWFIYLFMMWVWSVLDIAIREDNYYNKAGSS